VLQGLSSRKAVPSGKDVRNIVRQAEVLGPLEPAVFPYLPSVDDGTGRELHRTLLDRGPGIPRRGVPIQVKSRFCPATKPRVIEDDRLLWQPREPCVIACVELPRWLVTDRFSAACQTAMDAPSNAVTLN
jgi:hypothetical protein